MSASIIDYGLPTGKKYNVIYADCPWKYGSRGVRSGMYGALDYSSMTIEELMAMPVADIAADDCVLLMWVTGAFMMDAYDVAKAWGFKKYVRVDKGWTKLTTKGNRHGVVGPWGMSDMEFLLLFTRGKACSMQTERNQFVSISEPYTGKHSEKPAIFRNQIEDRFLDLPKIELFARERYDGWDSWGNEV